MKLNHLNTSKPTVWSLFLIMFIYWLTAARQRKVLPVLIIGLMDVLLGTTMLIMGLVAALAFGQGHHNFSDGGPAYYTGCFTGFLFVS